MYTNVNGKLIDSKVISIAPKGLKDYITNKLGTCSEVNEAEVFQLKARVSKMETATVEGAFIDDKEILAFARRVDLRLCKECGLLTEIVRTILFLSDGSSNNKIVALEQIMSALDIALIHLFKAKTKKKQWGDLYAIDYIQR